VSTATEELPSVAQARVSVATALGVAAANAQLLADQEERVIEHLVAKIIDNQVEYRLWYFATSSQLSYFFIARVLYTLNRTLLPSIF